MPIARATAALVLVAACTACTTHKSSAPSSPATIASAESSTAGSETESPATATSLPAGALVELVPSVAELPAGYSIVPDGAGPLDAGGAADLENDPDAASRSFTASGFTGAYSAEYDDERTGAFISVLVTRFAGAAGAHTEFARGVRTSAAGAETISVAPVGDESAAFREKVSEGDVAEIVSLRFRVRDLVWLVETGGQESADPALARDIAAKLVKRTA